MSRPLDAAIAALRYLRELSGAQKRLAESTEVSAAVMSEFCDQIVAREDDVFVNGAGMQQPAGILAQVLGNHQASAVLSVNEARALLGIGMEGDVTTLPMGISRREINGVVVEFNGMSAPVTAHIESVPPQGTISQTISDLRSICHQCDLYGIEHAEVDHVVQVLLPMAIFQPAPYHSFGMTFSPVPVLDVVVAEVDHWNVAVATAARERRTEAEDTTPLPSRAICLEGGLPVKTKR